MPWAHCDVGFILDTEDCPACGLSKASWTLQVDQTRVLMIGRKKAVEAWIEVELRDDQDRPVGHERYTCEFANGRLKTGALDAAGWVRIKPIFPGSCTIAFPDLEQAPQTRDAAAPRSAPSLGPRGRAAAAKVGGAPAGASPTESPSDDRDASDVDELTLKSSVTLRTRFRSLARARADLAAHPIEVRLDGERIPSGAFVASAQETRVHFRLPPGEHQLLISSQAEGTRRVLLSQRVRITAPDPAAEQVEADSAEAAPTAAARASAAGGPALAGVALRGVSGASRDEPSDALPPIEITRRHVEQGGGRRHLFRLSGKGLKASLPLRVRFRSLRRAQEWLSTHPIEVRVDGAPVTAGAVVESPQRIRVDFRLPVGEHAVLIFSQRGPARVVYLSKTLTVAGS